MRLYLSSYGLGAHADRIVDLVGRDARTFVILNALDAAPRPKRDELGARLARDFAGLGLDVEELDLREYFSAERRLVRDLAACDLVWASGGNAFTLLMAMTQSGFREALPELLDRDTLAYGGYSAGAVVAGRTLRGFELVDSADPADSAPLGYAPRIEWDGLELVDYSIVPHFRSDHWESTAIEGVVRFLDEQDMPYRALRDGEAILVDGSYETVLTIEG